MGPLRGAGSLVRYANLHGSLTLIGVGDERKTDRNQRATTMPTRPILTLNPFSESPERYRALARAALFSNSSLSVRLHRFNKAMAKARELEAQGGVQ